MKHIPKEIKVTISPELPSGAEDGTMFRVYSVSFFDPDRGPVSRAFKSGQENEVALAVNQVLLGKYQ